MDPWADQALGGSLKLRLEQPKRTGVGGWTRHLWARARLREQVAFGDLSGAAAGQGDGDWLARWVEDYRAVIEKMAGMQMVDVHLPTTDGRRLVLSRYAQPDRDQALLLQRLHLSLPDQLPPKISDPAEAALAGPTPALV